MGGGGTDPACYDLQAMACLWTFAGAALHPRDMALCDVDGDGRVEVVSGGADSFLYVLGHDGALRTSLSLGAPVCALAAIPPQEAGNATLAVGFGDGRVLVLGRNLEPMGQAVVAEGSAVSHLAVLRRAAGPPVVVAADADGNAVWVPLDSE